MFLNEVKAHKIYLITPLYLLLLICNLKATSQTYGLQFNGIEKSLDHRTELNLTPDGFLSFQNDFEISFEYRARRIYPDSNIGLFGYILRVINKEDKNVDLLSSIEDVIDSLYLNLVIGNKDSIINVNYPKGSLDNWIKLKVKFNLAKDQVIFYTPENFYVQENVGFNKRDEFKIIFGTNDYRQFKTSDVPTMSVRDVKISEQGNLKYHWILDEKVNNIAADRLLGQEAEVKNPVWLNLNHQIWQSKFVKEDSGELMITSDEHSGRIFIIGSKELEVFDANSNSSKKIPYQNKPAFLANQFKPVYNSFDGKIYTYLAEKGPAHSLDVETGVWENLGKRVANSVNGTNNRYYNRYYNKSDNSIYLFGGYGLHKYNNEISKLDIGKNELMSLPTNDSLFYPKYLSGLGTLNDTIYILGGYGSKSGNQLINPQSYYDFIGYSIKDSTLFKKFDIAPIMDDMCVANSMWIDKNTRDYYALVYEKSIFNGHLQMIKGNLENSKTFLVGNELPYQFLDVRSTAGLLYMEQQNKLFAYTTYKNDSVNTKVDIYSINYPPNKFVEETEEDKEPQNFTTLILTVFGLLLIGVVFLRLRKKKKNENVVSIKSTEDVTTVEKKVSEVKEEEIIEVEKINYQLIFFGGFQVINNKSSDITSQFTPLIKELFLLLWLHTYKNNKGISTEKITEVLWYDKSDKSAQNNRAVNLAKLRTLLSQLGNFKLSKKTGYWKCVFDESIIRSDYVHFLNLTSSKSNLTKQKINQLIEITKKGPFLRNVQYQWLDEFKARVSDITIDTLTYFAQTCDVNEEADFIIHLADSIFIFDVTNEDAMMLKCKAQYILGKHSHAKATYKKFSEEYKEMYGEEYEQSFVEVLKSED